jgi:hypothetical protein
MLIGPGQGGDSPMFPHLLAALAVPRTGPGRARNRPDKVLGDKAYSSRAPSVAAPSRDHRGDSRARRPARAPATAWSTWRTPGELRRRDLQGTQRRRALLQRLQAMARPGHAIRQARTHLPRRGCPAGNQHLAPPIRRHALVDDLFARVRTPDSKEDVEEIRDLGTTLLGLLVRHRQRGSDLVYEAYELDVGGET